MNAYVDLSVSLRYRMWMAEGRCLLFHWEDYVDMFTIADVLEDMSLFRMSILAVSC